MTTGEKILNMRKARGWNQEELAERIGVTRQAVSRWESGAAKPDADKIIAICDLFGVSADYLLRDVYSEEGNIAGPEKQPVNTSTQKAQSMTLRQWTACCAVLAGGLIMFILKLIHVFRDTNYSYHSESFYCEGFPAFLRFEDLLFVWYLALMAFLGGLFYLFIWPAIWPMIQKDKERNPWPWESD